MATLWWLDSWVRGSPKLQLFRGVPILRRVPILHWSVSIKSDPRKEQWWIHDSVMGGQGSLMHLRVWRLAHTDQSNRRAAVCQIAEEVNTGFDRKCIAVCCLWGWIAADQSGCPWWPLSATQSANNGHVSIRTEPWSPTSSSFLWPPGLWADGYRRPVKLCRAASN